MVHLDLVRWELPRLSIIVQIQLLVVLREVVQASRHLTLGVVPLFQRPLALKVDLPECRILHHFQLVALQDHQECLKVGRCHHRICKQVLVVLLCRVVLRLLDSLDHAPLQDLACHLAK